MGEDKQADIKQPKSPINKEIMNIAWPVLIELVLSSLFGMINMMMLGNIADHGYAAAAVAAVGVTNQPLFLGLAVVAGFEYRRHSFDRPLFWSRKT